MELPASGPKRIALLLLAVAYVLAGVGHFVAPEFYLAMMPDYLPWHLGLVYLSGVFEVVGGVAVLVPRVRSLAGWGLIALLVAVFPANLNMALHPEDFPDFEPWQLWARLPFQLVFIAWAWWATRPDDG